MMHPPDGVQTHDWVNLCERFASEAFQKISAKNKINRSFNKVPPAVGSLSVARRVDTVFRKEPFFYRHGNYDQLVKIAMVLGTGELNTYLQRHRLELDPHLVALVGRLEPWTKFINSDNQHLAVSEAVDFLDKLFRYDHQERPPAKEAMLLSIFEEKWGVIESDWNYGPVQHNQRQFGHSHSPNFVNPVRRIHVPKKPKAREPNKRDMTYEEKQKLSLNLQNIPSHHRDGVVHIIKKNNTLSQNDEEIEIDIDSVDIETLWELDRKKGQPKKKKARKNVFTVNFHFDGIFTSWPLKYAQGQVIVITDTNFDEMSYEHLKEIAKKLVPHALFEKIYYCQTGVKLTLGLREIKSTQDIVEMMKVGYESGNEIDMYVEHFGYDIMELVKLEVNKEHNHNCIEESDDEYYGSDDYKEIENVDFQTGGDESVVIKSISTHDPFLTKLCSARIMFRGTAEHLQTEEPLADPDDHQIHAVNKVQSGVLYPAFDPDIPWDKMEPTLLWYMKNDWREVLVYCGRNVEEGRCAGKKGNKDRVMKNKVRSGVQTGVKKKVLKKKVVKKKPVSDSGEGTSQSPKWTKKQIRDSKQVVCPFRMYASWMSNEHSFQIKSLNSEHKCCRNYNLGSLVTFRWIALHFFKEIIEDPFMSLRKIRADIRKKFMIDVSLGQCRRAKQLALFDHEGGLIEHYGRLYQYRQALLDSNPGSTCRLDVEESSNGSATFKRIYICFKGVKDGWLLGCRKVIVRVENADNWGWFLHLLHDDLSLNYGNGITIISDSHKGLIDAVNDWLPEAEHKKCTRHIYANFKKKYSGLLYQRLFLGCCILYYRTTVYADHGSDKTVR
ncbi:calcium/proton exchanger [Tanacetum coccineum]